MCLSQTPDQTIRTAFGAFVRRAAAVVSSAGCGRTRDGGHPEAFQEVSVPGSFHQHCDMKVGL